MYLHSARRAIYDFLDRGTSSFQKCTASIAGSAFLKGEQGIVIMVHTVLHSNIRNHINTLADAHTICAYCAPITVENVHS